MSRLNRYLEKRKPKIDVDQAWSVNSSPEPSPGYPSAESVDPYATATLEHTSVAALVAPATVDQPALAQAPQEASEEKHTPSPVLESQGSRPNLCPDALPQPSTKPRLDLDVMPTSPSPATTTCGSRVVVLSNPEPTSESTQIPLTKQRQHVPLSQRFVEQSEPSNSAPCPPAATTPNLLPDRGLRRPGIYIPATEKPIHVPMPHPHMQRPPYVFIGKDWSAVPPISVGSPPVDPSRLLPISIGAPCYAPAPELPYMYPNHYPPNQFGVAIGSVEFDGADPFLNGQGFALEGLSEWLAEASMGNVSANDDRPLCLDYLKGRCKQNRYKCKFAHPALEGAPAMPAEVQEQLAVQDDLSAQVCEVWVLTGFCKFGSKCHYQHPPMTAPGAGVQCSPAVTKKMQEYAKRVARWRETANAGEERPTDPSGTQA